MNGAMKRPEVISDILAVRTQWGLDCDGNLLSAGEAKALYRASEEIDRILFADPFLTYFYDRVTSAKACPNCRQAVLGIYDRSHRWLIGFCPKCRKPEILRPPRSWTGFDIEAAVENGVKI